MAARRGADLISTFNLALYRMQGLSSMAGYLPIGADPTRDMRRFVDRLATAGDFQALLAGASRLHGYVGGSSAERFPIEQSGPVATQGFKAVRLPVS